MPEGNIYDDEIMLEVTVMSGKIRDGPRHARGKYAEIDMGKGKWFSEGRSG